MITIKKLVFVLSLSLISSALYADSYMSHTEIGKLPEIQQNFVHDLVKASRTNDPDLINSLLHSSVLNNKKCSRIIDGFHKKVFKKTNIPKDYAVRVKKGRNKGTLTFKLRYESPEKPGARSFKKFGGVVEENGRLVIKVTCR